MPIAERLLRLVPEDVPVPIRIEAPEPSERGWRCRYAIGWPVHPHEHAGYGADAIQAVHITLRMIGAELYASEAHEAGRLVWPAAGGAGGYGFSVPANLRDLLVGDDAREC